MEMRPLCQTCANIFNYPECCTEKLGDSVTIIAHCRNYSGASMQGEESKLKEIISLGSAEYERL